MPSCRVCGLEMAPGWEAVVAAAILGLEAAAYVSLVICTALLLWSGMLGMVRWLAR